MKILFEMAMAMATAMTTAMGFLLCRHVGSGAEGLIPCSTRNARTARPFAMTKFGLSVSLFFSPHSSSWLERLSVYRLRQLAP